jgi:RecB family exonuclease
VAASGHLDDALRHHIGKAFERLVHDRPEHDHPDDEWTQAYFASEQQRLLVRLHEWMQHEAERQPFTVEAREQRLPDVHVGELKLNLRADRIDALPDGSHLLIDYKSGEVATAGWQGERLDEPQLPLYAAYGNVENVNGLLFAQIRAGKTGFIGRVANAQQQLQANLPASNPLVNQRYDKGMRDGWQSALLHLAEEFLRGEASVDPKHGATTCQYCPLPGLCRIAEVEGSAETDDAEADND